MLKVIRSFKNHTLGEQIFSVGFGMMVLGFAIYFFGEFLNTATQFHHTEVTIQIAVVFLVLSLFLWIIGAFKMCYETPKSTEE